MGQKTLNALQRDAARVAEIYRDTFDITADPAWYLGKLSEEMGELSNAYLRSTGQTRHVGSADDMAQEAADILGFLLVFCDWQGIDLAEAFNRKWGKYLEPEDESVS